MSQFIDNADLSDPLKREDYGKRTLCTILCFHLSTSLGPDYVVRRYSGVVSYSVIIIISSSMIIIIFVCFFISLVYFAYSFHLEKCLYNVHDKSSKSFTCLCIFFTFVSNSEQIYFASLQF